MPRFSILQRICIISILVILVSCSSDDRPVEGTFTYEIEYPYYQGSGFMAKMLPDKMTMKFKDNMIRTEVKKGKAFSTIFLVDCNDKKMTVMFQFGTRRKYAEPSDAQIKTMVEQFPAPIYMHTNEADSVSGFFCNKSVAVFEAISQPDVTLYYTEDINIENANWYNPYSEIKGVLLGYELDRYGLRMRFTATKFDPSPLEEKDFEVPSNFKKVPFDELEKEMEGMFKTLVE